MEFVIMTLYHDKFKDLPIAFAPAMLRALDEKLKALGRGEIVDGVGRGIALDRDGNYARIQKAYECMTLGKGTQYR